MPFQIPMVKKCAKQSCRPDADRVSGLREIAWKIATNVSDQRLATHPLKSPVPVHHIGRQGFQFNYCILTQLASHEQEHDAFIRLCPNGSGMQIVTESSLVWTLRLAWRRHVPLSMKPKKKYI